MPEKEISTNGLPSIEPAPEASGFQGTILLFDALQIELLVPPS
ncbi:MAG TPA: hypothetical protein VEZ70_04060 [Allosphingosinicella sp.]|nr:hypothetical protein [Allosphingosinicella sp.]